MGPGTRTTRTALAALILVSALSTATIVAVRAQDPPDAPRTPHMAGMMGNGTHGTMGDGVTGRANLSDPYDLRFLDEMIPHHEMALMMVRMMIDQSDRPELRDLGQRIVADQQQQLDQMRAWRQRWYSAAPPPTDPMGGMMGSHGTMGNHGTTGDPMMGGDRADRMFLTMMIPHHEMAIEMGTDALTNAQHPELTGLVRDIIAGQSAEIAEMRGYLSAWYGITP